MSALHPIIAIAGSSGAGTTTTASRISYRILKQLDIKPAWVTGDAFHRYTRAEMGAIIAEAERAGRRAPSHFGPESNLWSKLEALFREYGEHGTGTIRRYVHDEADAARWGHPAGQFTPWQPLPANSDLLFYEGLHGGVVTDEVDIARHVDLLIGVAPIVNLEWIQKIHRDTSCRGYSREAVMQTILRRMYDYVHYITPQFSRTHINFQRVPVVDTSNPFAAETIPGFTESFVIIRFADSSTVDFPSLLAEIEHSFQSKDDTLVIPGGAINQAVQLIIGPMIGRLLEKSRQARKLAQQ